ncbi:MAG: cysteine hydrolase family protein [Planctomycetales bacterium]|nr:cysteine hydrolase family protein [Planctomycetales bacterium]
MNEHEMVQQLLNQKDQTPIAIDAENTALIVVDVQRFFSRPEYPFAQAFEKMVSGVTAGYFRRVEDTVLPNVERLLTCFRARKLPVVYFAVGCHTPEGRDLPAWMREFDDLSLMLNGQRVCPPAGDPSGAIEDCVAPLPGEIVLTKSSSGPGASTNLQQILRNLSVRSLVVCGLTTAVCVSQSARELADLGFQVIVAEDACTELSVESHRAALFTFALTFGRVRPTVEIIELFKSILTETTVR